MSDATTTPWNAKVKTLSPGSHRLECGIALAIVIVPLLGIVAAGMLAWGRGLAASDLILAAALYSLTMLGITVGFHRHFTHKSFDASPALRAVLGVLGSMALQGPIIRWVADHRRHHAFSDRDGDPHSPHLEETGGLGGYLQGLWHAHVGWFFSREKTVIRRYAPDLLKDSWVTSVDRLYGLWAVASLSLPAGMGALIEGGAHGAASGFLWGGLVRLFLVHHATWSVNSICHLFGKRPNATSDESRNNAVMAVLVFGEGWHNNHHAKPWSARHGWSRGQIDLSYAFIRAMAKLGLVWNVKTYRPADEPAGAGGESSRLTVLSLRPAWETARARAGSASTRVRASAQRALLRVVPYACLAGMAVTALPTVLFFALLLTARVCRRSTSA